MFPAKWSHPTRDAGALQAIPYNRYMEMLTAPRGNDGSVFDESPSSHSRTKQQKSTTPLDNGPSPPPCYPPRAPMGSRDPNYPDTWPELFLAYHCAEGQSKASELHHMLADQRYAGQTAKTLKELLLGEIAAAETMEEKEDVMHTAFLLWPWNVTHKGDWKVKPYLAPNELVAWYQLRVEVALALSDESESGDESELSDGSQVFI